MITPSYLGETIEYSSLHACRSTLEDPTRQPAYTRSEQPGAPNFETGSDSSPEFECQLGNRRDRHQLRIHAISSGRITASVGYFKRPMKRSELIMGMPITIEILDSGKPDRTIGLLFDYFRSVDRRFSTYKSKSEISRINRGLPRHDWSDEMRRVMDMCEQTKRETNGYFDIRTPDGTLDPSGLVKGWSIQNAAEMALRSGSTDFYIEAGGDIQIHGNNSDGEPWKIGIRNPFGTNEIVKTIHVRNKGVATSGTYIRGQHIYDPHTYGKHIEDVKSLTVIGPNIYEADRYATAAFAMGADGVNFIEALPGYEAYMINSDKIATMTSGFEHYVS